MISVVIPLYNKELFIAKAIQSVLDQSFRNFELLVVNDQSSDASVEVVRNFEDQRIRLINIDKSGVSVTRNTGIQNSKFEWIAFLDADDWWDTHFLEEMVAAINTHTEYKLFASGRTHVFSKTSRRYANEFLPLEGEVAAINFFKVNTRYLPLINSSNAVIKKSHLDEVGYFNPNQKMHEDHDLWIRLSLGEDVIFINKNLSFYRNTELISASKMYYDPEDFCVFLNTLIKTRLKISGIEKKFFKTYCNRFVLLTYIKNYRFYSKIEDKMVRNLALQLLHGKHRILMHILIRIPLKNTYPFFKRLKSYNGT